MQMNLGPHLQLRIHPLFFFIAGFIGYFIGSDFNSALSWIFIFLTSLFAHEFGKACVFLYAGYRTRITLLPFGGKTEYHGPRLRTFLELLSQIMGPLSNLALAAAFFSLHRFINTSAIPINSPFAMGAFFNVFWIMLNLLPLPPLCGWQIIRISLEHFWSSKGTRWAYRIGLFFCFIAAISTLILGPNYLLLTVFSFILAFQAYVDLKKSQELTDTDRNPDLNQLYQDAKLALVKTEFKQAQTLFEKLKEESQNGRLYRKACEHLAALLNEQGEFEAAYKQLLPIKKQLSEAGHHLMHQLAYKNNDFEAVIELATTAYNLQPSANIAFMNAVANAYLAHKQPAIGWLECAKREGLANWEFLDQPPFNSWNRNDFKHLQ